MFSELVLLLFLGAMCVCVKYSLEKMTAVRAWRVSVAIIVAMCLSIAWY